MKQTDFAVSLNRFLTDYLVNKRGSTAKTIDAYRYAFIFLLDYYNDNLLINSSIFNWGLACANSCSME